MDSKLLQASTVIEDLGIKISIQEPRRIHKSPFGSSSIYQIYFDEFSRSQLDQGFTWIQNHSLTPLLESDVLDLLIRNEAHRDAEFFGVFSWKAKLKLGITSEMTFRFLDEIRYDCDILTFPFDPLGPNCWSRDSAEGVKSAPFLEAGQILMKLLGIEVDLKSLRTPIIYQNAFLARSWVMERFHREMFAPAMALLRDPSNKELHSALIYNAQYPLLSSIRTRILRAFGNSFFTYHPFIAEVLFPTWIGLQPEELMPRIYIPAIPKIRAGTATSLTGAC